MRIATTRRGLGWGIMCSSGIMATTITWSLHGTDLLWPSAYCIIHFSLPLHVNFQNPVNAVTNPLQPTWFTSSNFERERKTNSRSFVGPAYIKSPDLYPQIYIHSYPHWRGPCELRFTVYKGKRRRRWELMRASPAVRSLSPSDASLPRWFQALATLYLLRGLCRGSRKRSSS